MREFLPEMSRKYGIKVFSFDNPEYPYFVDAACPYDDPFDRDCGCTEEEIKAFVDYHHQSDELTPWACQIIGWYESNPYDIEEVLAEIQWYLETMYGIKEIDDYPEWLQNFLYDIDENPDADDDTLRNIIEKVMPYIV